MKIALIIGGNKWFCPFIEIYTKVLAAQNIEYDILYWDKTNTERSPLSYNLPANDTDCLLRKFINYFRYASYLKKTIKKNAYDRLIVFNSVCGIFLYSFLRKKYRNKFIFDYRDLSIEQYVFFKPIFKRLLSISQLNVISSPGFKKCLPDNFNYIISHNFDIDIVRDAISKPSLFQKINLDKIDVLTIGGIRDFESNIEVVDALANKSDFHMRFVGKGLASESIRDYCGRHNIRNVMFYGYYEKKDEAAFIHEASFLNIYYPSIISHSTALSNRFYNALIYKTPMIVKADSIQGDYVQKYGLGIVAEDCADLDVKLHEYLRDVNFEIFCNRANALLLSFIKDYDYFLKKVQEFVNI